MKYTNTHFQKIFFFFVLLSSSVIGQIPKDSIIPRPSGYTISQVRWINALGIDVNDNKWVAFNLIGLGKLDASQFWIMYDSLNSPLPTNRILSVCCNASGVWAGTNSGLYNFDGTNWKWYKTTNSNIPSDTVPNLYSVGGNTLMIFSNKGFVYFNGTSFTSYNKGNSGLVNDTVQCIFQSSTGMWWIGTIHGLSSFNGTAWQNYTQQNSFSCDDNILSLIEDKNNALFIGTNAAGLLIKSGTNFNPINEYLSGYSELKQPAIANMLRLSDGRVMIPGYFISMNPTSITVKNFTSSYTYYLPSGCSVIDKSDRIWWITKPLTYNIKMADSLQFYPDALKPPSENYKMNFLDINEVKCPIWNNNTFFWDAVSNVGKYEVPKNYCGGKSALFSSALWIGGLDTSGKVHVAAQTYRQSGSDFWPGPLDTINAKIDSTTLMRYDSTWKVNRYTVDEFITQYQLGNVTNGTYKVPNVILNWPAHGSGDYSRNLAPFIDKNGDGIYNPYDADYPDVKGDQMLWWVMNDHYVNTHQETGGIPLGIEVQSKAYAYSCQNISNNDEAVNYSTFYSDNIINRSDTDYHDVYVGIWVDSDLGNFYDDYVGCRVNGDYGFSYNGDNNDEGASGYGVNPPMISVAILKGPKAELNDGLDNNHNGTIDEPGENCMMNHFMYYDNDGGPNGNPNAIEYYNYMKSIWRDSTHVTYGGQGNGLGLGATSIPTDYFYPGMPGDTGWTETSAGNKPDDRRFLMSSGPFSLRAHQSKTLDYAIVFSWDKTQPNGVNTSVAKNDADVMKVKHWFEKDSFPCKNSSIGINEIENNNGLFIYPNPAQGQYSLVFKGASKGEMELLDITGRVVKQQTVFANQKNNIDVHDVARGMYLVKVKNSQGALTRKIIIE